MCVWGGGRQNSEIIEGQPPLWVNSWAVMIQKKPRPKVVQKEIFWHDEINKSYWTSNFELF